MKRKELLQLSQGDVVRSKFSGDAFIVTGNYKSGVVAVRQVLLTNHDEYDLVYKAELSRVAPP